MSPSHYVSTGETEKGYQGGGDIGEEETQETGQDTPGTFPVSALLPTVFCPYHLLCCLFSQESRDGMRRREKG